MVRARRVAARLLIRVVFRFCAVCPATEDDHMLVHLEHDVSGFQLTFA